MALTVKSKLPLFVDYPADHKIRHPYEHIWGWLGVKKAGWLGFRKADGLFRVRVNGQPVKFASIIRPELDAISHIGFSIFLDLPAITNSGAIRPEEKLSIEFFLDEGLLAVAELDVVPGVFSKFDELQENRAAKRRFVLENASVNFRTDVAVDALNALPPDWPISPLLQDKKDAVSAHPYGAAIHQFLNSLPGDAFVLDAGAGLRRQPTKNIINLEIYDYPSTDVLAVGQKLPFRDSIFDGILSIAVLEHVEDPFICASELARVLKPGGKLMAIVPFLQAEHGYPSHYFNATRFGLRRLFKSLEVETQFLELSNHPIFTLEQILSTYANGLPKAQRSKFLGMTIAEILSMPAIDRYLSKADVVTHLSEDASWGIAWGTTGIFRKPS